MVVENLLKGLVLTVYFLVSGFVFKYGKKDSKIDIDYVVFSILMVLIFLRL